MSKPIFICGPCVIEEQDILNEICSELYSIQKELDINIIFKASFDKANRTSIHSYRGPGLERSVEVFKNIKKEFGFQITTDIHESYQAKILRDVIDVFQIPAFLCRQTDLLRAAAETGRTVNVKKAQFLEASSMIHVIDKLKEAGCENILVTERGTLFGPNNLVVNFPNLLKLKEYGVPVIMDCTHAAQIPSSNSTTGGNRELVPYLAKAAKVFNTDGYFFEVHPNPERALSDGPNSLNLINLKNLLKSLI